MEGEMKHFSHKHPLILKAEELKIDDGTHPPDMKPILCDGCSDAISGPFYSCRECVYYLHKVCAELPTAINHPMHPQHTLTLLSSPPYGFGGFWCDMCRATGGPFVYNCSLCNFDVDLICASASHTIRDKCHEHPLIPLQLPISFMCHICRTEKKGVSYKCTICPFWVHQNCILSLPSTVKHNYHDHILTLLQSAPPEYENVIWNCNICRDRISMFCCVYFCERCVFFSHVNCVRSRDQNIEIKQDINVDDPHLVLPVPHTTTDLISLFAKNYSNRDAITSLISHFSHEHPLVLKAEERKINDGTNQSVEIIKCNGCSTPISGPFYSCEECGYYLHKVCAELPSEMNHPMHPQHPLSLLSSPPYREGKFWCYMCREKGTRFVYNCSICSFDVGPICASASHDIEDKCHQHPLIPLQFPISFPCHICRTEEKGISYKCNICRFWVHQNCTVSLPNTVKHSDHRHPLTLLQSLPPIYDHVSRYCDICYNLLSAFHCVYHCAGCLFFAHISCARSRDQDISLMLGFQSSVQQKSRDLIARFTENCTNQYNIIKKEIKFLSHKHRSSLIDQVSKEICEACVLPISTSSYGCIDGDYYFHKCCTKLPIQLLHPAHPQHQISLSRCREIFRCSCCEQWCNGFGYTCLCEKFFIDIKCASVLRPVKHGAHKHDLTPRFTSSSSCTACGDKSISNVILQCNTLSCSFTLCFICAMAPPTVKHRYDKHPFMLAYSPPNSLAEEEYICDLCEEDLNPKYWFYHCRLCDQSTHLRCMLNRGADSNIKYGKSSYKFIDHEHWLDLVSCTYNTSFCNKCGFPMRTGYSVGLECKTCDFIIHLLCVLDIPTSLPN